jgi:DNA invertase Pin-like site-specific DNA recombinase
VSGADPIEARPGFSALLDRLEGNGVRTLIVEDASRFARDLVAQELGLLLLIKRGVRVLTANGDDLTDTSDPSRVMMRQIAGSFAQYEKARLVTKLRGARERVREALGKCEGRKSYAERDPELVLAAKRLHRRSPKGHRRSLREIAKELAAMGYTNKSGEQYSSLLRQVDDREPSALSTGPRPARHRRGAQCSWRSHGSWWVRTSLRGREARSRAARDPGGGPCPANW